MSFYFENKDIYKFVDQVLTNESTDTKVQISQNIIKSLSFDEKNVAILSNPETIAREIIFEKNNFYKQ